MPERVSAGQRILPGVRGVQQNVPFVQPGGARKENREAERFGKAGQLNGAVLTPTHHGAQRIGRRPVRARHAPARGLRAYEEAAVRRMRNRNRDKSISADSGVGNKGVKAGTRRTAKAAGFYHTFTCRRPAASGQADRSHKRQAQRDDCAPSGGPGPEGFIWAERPCDLLQSPFSDSSRYRCPMAGGG